MGKQIIIPMVEDLDADVGDFIVANVDAVEQPGRITEVPATRTRRGYGKNNHGEGGYGFGKGRVYGAGRYGSGWYGQGAERKTPETAGNFDAGDYSVKLQAEDRAGNSQLSAATTIAHRPNPFAPYAVTVTGGAVAFAWTGV